MSQQPTQRYAQALFDLCRDHGKVDAVRHDLKQITGLLEKSDEFERFVTNPIIPREKRLEILQDMLSQKLDAITYRYILFLEQKKRLYLIKNICEKFEDLYLEWKDTCKVRISSTRALESRELEAIRRHLKNKLNKNIEPETVVDKEMIGGIKVQVGDVIYDYSLQTQLERFKAQLLNA